MHSNNSRPTPPKLIQQLQQLLQENSVSSTLDEWDNSNTKVIHKLADWLVDLGFFVDLQPLPEQPQKLNLIAKLGSGEGGLVFSGHSDTVPFDEGRWSFNPLDLTQCDNRLYGLGATDMKGFFPIVMEAVRQYQAKDLRQPIYVIATADEESSMDGARALVNAAAPKARFAVIGEPTSLQPIHAHKGIMMNAVTVRGRSGHSSNPALGNNALEAMALVLQDLLNFRAQLQQQYRNELFAVNVPTLNLGCIHGGDNPNRICAECEVHFDLRILPGMDSDAINLMIQRRLQPLAEKLNINISLRELVKPVNPFAEAKQSDWIRLCESLSEQSAASVAFATEAPFFQAMGMQTVVMGPGSIDQAHQPDEYLALDQLTPAIKLYRQLIERCCI